MKRWIACVPVLVVLGSGGRVDAAVDIDMVTVGNPGNLPDTRYNGVSVGAVAQDYRIGT